MKKVIVFLAILILFVILAILFGGTRNVSFSVPGILTVVLALAVCLSGDISNVLDPLKCAAFIYAMAFAALPIFFDPPDLLRYSKSSIHSGQWYLLLYFCFMLIGYKIWQFIFPVKINSYKHQETTLEAKGVNKIALIIFILGLFGYLYIVIKSGGVGYFLSFERSRIYLLEDTKGIYLRLSIFMSAGYALFATANIRKRPVVTGAISLILAMLYALLMGRGRAVAPLIIFTFLYHYLVKQLKFRHVAIGCVAGVLLVAATGVLRSAGHSRIDMLKNPIDFISSFASTAGEHTRGTILGYLEHLDTFMLSKEYINAGNPLLNGKTLSVWFEPFDRHFFGNKLFYSIHAGHFVWVLQNPNYKNLQGGVWPTLMGEFVLNFGLLGTIACMMIYGACIQMLSRFLKSGYSSLIAFSIYSYLFYILVRAIVSGTEHITGIVIFATPLLIASFFINNQSLQIKWLIPKHSQFNSIIPSRMA